MDPVARARFNAAARGDPAMYERYGRELERLAGAPIGFRLAETPVFLTPHIRERLQRAGDQIVAQLCEPERIAKMRAAVPARWDVPGESRLPTMVAVDFAIASVGGRLEPRLVELQGFPSLLAFETVQRDAWEAELQRVRGLQGAWVSWFGGLNRASFLDLARRTILGERTPEETILLDLDPVAQKTYCDFTATKQLFGVDAVCPTKLEKRGRKLYRTTDDGRELPVERIYYRLVIDELERKKVQLPFDLREELDVEWSPHPNWFWIWSKYSLPFLDHPAVPRTTLLSELGALPRDLEEAYVLKPLFSFAGGGVNIHPTAAAVAAIPKKKRAGWCLQEKIPYAGALHASDGGRVKVEVRMMYLRPDSEATFVPATNLCRLARGEMLGVDFNRDMTWVGSSIGIWKS